MPTGYCTVDDVRRVLQDTVAEFDSGATGNNQNQVVVDAIESQTEWVEKTLKRHWYMASQPSEDTHGLIPTSTQQRNDEESFSSGAVYLSGTDDDDVVEPQAVQGSYTRIRLDRRDAQSISELLVRDGDGNFVDWVASTDYTGGTYPSALGDDYYVRVNNGGWSYLYIDVDSMRDSDGDFVLDSLTNAVYITFDYGHDGLPTTVRRATAMRAASQLLASDDAANLGIPENANLQSIESKVSALERQADELLEVYR